MHDPFPARSARPVRRVAATVLGGLIVLGATACTGDDTPDAEPSTRPTPTSQSTSTIEARPAPLKVRVTRVAGRMRPKDQEVLARKVGSVVSAYFDAAFLGGDYPRSSFGNAFRAFSKEAARQAGRDRDLLTNRKLGPTTESVVARTQTAYLSVLAPHKVAAGVTAKVELTYVAQRGAQPDQEVTVRGRLLLTRQADGDWTIFGYDLDRSARTVGEGS